MTNFIFILLLVHGLGHLLGVIAAFRKSRWEEWNTDSWLLGRLLDKKTLKSVAAILFLIPALASIAGAFIIKGLLFNISDWRAVVLFAAISSLVAIGLFPKALFTNFNKIAAVALNLLILGVMLKEPFVMITL